MPTCVGQFGGYEGAVGWVEESSCGVTPTTALTGFGYVQNVEPTYEKGSVKGRQVGSQKLSYQMQAAIDVALSIEYTPVERVLDDLFKYAIGQSGVVDPHLLTRSIERGVKRTSPAGEYRELFNMCKVNSLTLEAAVGEEWKITEELFVQYMQSSTSKTYSGYQSLTVGADPAEENDIPLMYYDNDIQICRHQSETYTGITGTTQVTTYEAEDIDGDTSYTDDVRVFINGVEDTVVSYVPATKTVTWTTSVIVTDTVVVEYYKLAENIENLTDISIEINRNQNRVRGIKSGLPIVYEIVEGAFEASVSVTQNFDSYDELTEMVNDNYICLFVGIGTKVFRLLHGKFDGPPGPYTPEDLISVGLDAEFEDVVYT